MVPMEGLEAVMVPVIGMGLWSLASTTGEEAAEAAWPRAGVFPSMLEREAASVAWPEAVAAPAGSGSEEALTGWVACQKVPVTACELGKFETLTEPLTGCTDCQKVPLTGWVACQKVPVTAWVDGKLLTETVEGIEPVTFTLSAPAVAEIGLPSVSLIRVVGAGGVSARAR